MYCFDLGEELSKAASCIRNIYLVLSYGWLTCAWHFQYWFPTKVTTGSLEPNSSATPTGQHQLHISFLHYFPDTLFPSCRN